MRKSVGVYNRHRGVAIVKFTKRIQFALTPWLFKRIRKEAQQQKVSVSNLVRTAVEKHLGELIWRRIETINVEKPTPTEKPKRASLLDTPVVQWTPEEEETAYKAMQLFRNHDE
jgi:hypothetical protein